MTRDGDNLEKYGREFRVISRWEPTSQKCSCCGFKGGKKELNVREWTCLNCGTFHDRDINAAINILNAVETVNQPITKVEEPMELKNPIQISLFNIVAGGHSETENKTRSRRQPARKKAVANNESSTRPESFVQLSLFD